MDFITGKKKTDAARRVDLCMAGFDIQQTACGVCGDLITPAERTTGAAR